MAYARYFSGLSMAAGHPDEIRSARDCCPAASPASAHQCGIGTLGLICPSGGPGATCRIRETGASSRSRPRCTEVSGLDPPDGSESLLTELVSAAILRASPLRVTL